MPGTISSLLTEMLIKISSGEHDFTITAQAKLNIKKIQKICNDKYFDQHFYGSAALNRMILLDKKIAELLTPETILALLAMHAKTTKLDHDSPIGVFRNTTGYLSLAAVLFYGFSEGLEIIKLLPNNEPNYGIHPYQEQKKKFTENTTKIINNIEQAAAHLNITTNSKKTLLEEGQVSLSQLFNSITDTIICLKKAYKSEELLFVPKYTPQAIREQALLGFQAICSSLNIPYTVKPPHNISLHTTTLEDFIKNFLTTEKTLLDGEVIHLFYDRAHLEACIEQDTKIIFKDKAYSLKDILKEMVVFCEKSPLASQTAREQFKVRLKSCETHLKREFPFYYKKENIQPHTQQIINFPPEYYEIKELLFRIEEDITNDKALWACKNPKNDKAQRDFLRQILTLYEKADGQISLKDCFLTAKKNYPEGYQLLRSNTGADFIFAILNTELTQKLRQGPRFKTYATVMLEELLHALLSNYKTMNCSYNALEELEITIDGKLFNVTQILLYEPDFEHILFSDEHLTAYESYIHKHPWNKTAIELDDLDKVPRREDYEKWDTKREWTHLHYGEKLAITAYSSEFHYIIQQFLRNKGQVGLLKSLPAKQQNKIIPKILLSAAIAAHGLSRKSVTVEEHDDSVSKTYRKERSPVNANYLKERLEACKLHHALVERGFLSTSKNNSFFQTNSNIFVVFRENSVSNTIGRNVTSLSLKKEELEILYAPGTQLQYTDYHAEEGKHFFAVRPTRSIDGIQNNTYLKYLFAAHEIEVIDKIMQIYLKENAHSSVRRLIDTVDNSKKIECIREARVEIEKSMKEINEIFEKINRLRGEIKEFKHIICTKFNTAAEGESFDELIKLKYGEIAILQQKLKDSFIFETLTYCRDVLEKATTENLKLVKQAVGPASAGKTGKLLQDALERVEHALKLIKLENLNTTQKDIPLP
ncbi:hypothetical protein [Legionella gresilensis]|uniref:hypothetical protein n=1 Tax=Legionella gresilensis TaxID=91823 RepID=UPI00104128E0|nr:hypothetical protein [Legionella gresilensis]